MTDLNDLSVVGDALLGATPHAYAILDLDHTIVNVSDTYLKTTGASKDDLIGHSIFDAFPENPADRTGTAEMLRVSLDRVGQSGERDELEFRHPIPVRDQPGIFDNQWWRVVNTALKSDGQIIGILHHGVNITDRIFAQRDMEIRERLAKQLTHIAYWQFIPSAGHAIASAALWDIFELPETDGPFDPALLFDRYQPEDGKRQVAELKNLENSPVGTEIEGEYQINLSEGKTKWVNIRGELVRENPQDPAGFVGIAIDITSSKIYASELAETIEDRDALLAQKELLLDEVNHRIKNSLQIVSSVLNLDARKASGEEARQRLTAAGKRVQAVASVHELIYKAGQVTTVEFGDYLHRLCQSLEDSTHGRIECSSDPFDISTDKAISIALLVNELVANAFEHGIKESTDGVVSVTSKLEADHLILTVVDNGVGKSASVEKGLGSFITSAMVQQLDGDVTEGTPANPNRDGSNTGHQVLVSIPLTE